MQYTTLHVSSMEGLHTQKSSAASVMDIMHHTRSQTTRQNQLVVSETIRCPTIMEMVRRTAVSTITTRDRYTTAIAWNWTASRRTLSTQHPPALRRHFHRWHIPFLPGTLPPTLRGVAQSAMRTQNQLTVYASASSDVWLSGPGHANPMAISR